MKSFILFIILTISFLIIGQISSAKTNKWKFLYDISDNANSNSFKSFKPDIQPSLLKYTGDSLTCTFFGSGDSGIALAIRTEDGGNTWSKILSTPTYKLNNHFITYESSGGSDFMIYTFDPDTTLRTIDGGKKWDTVITNLNGTIYEIDLQANGIGFGVVFSKDSSKEILIRTTDYGTTWKPLVNQPQSSEFKDAPNKSNKVFFIKTIILSDSVYACLAMTYDTYWLTDPNYKCTYYFCRTDDAGKTWSKKSLLSGLGNLTSIGNLNVSGMYFINKSVGWITTDSLTLNSRMTGLWKTTDGGTTWIRKYLAVPEYRFYYINGISFYDTLRGSIFGYYGYILQTYDGGESWKVDSSISEVDNDQNNIKFQGKYLSSKKMICINFKGRIYLYDEDGFPESEILDPICRFNDPIVFPNPTTQTATIKFDLEQPANVSLKLTDMLGNQISLIENQFMDSGSHSYDLDASNYPAGGYCYVLQMGGNVKTGKVVVVK